MNNRVKVIMLVFLAGILQLVIMELAGKSGGILNVIKKEF